MTDTDRLKNKWASRNIVKCDKSQCEVLRMGWTNSLQLCTLEDNWMRSSFAEKDPMFLVKTRIYNSMFLVNKKANSS